LWYFRDEIALTTRLSLISSFFRKNFLQQFCSFFFNEIKMIIFLDIFRHQKGPSFLLFFFVVFFLEILQKTVQFLHTAYARNFCVERMLPTKLMSVGRTFSYMFRKIAKSSSDRTNSIKFSSFIQKVINLGTNQLDLFCTSIKILCSMFSVLRPGRSSTHRLYFDQNYTSTCTSRPIKIQVCKKVEVKRRSKEFEVDWPK